MIPANIIFVVLNIRMSRPSFRPGRRWPWRIRSSGNWPIQTPGGVLIHFSVRGRASEQGIIFRIPTPGQGIVFVYIGSMTGSRFVIFLLQTVVLGHLDSANVIQIASMAIFPHFSIDFVQISLQSTNLSEETKGQGIV